MKKIRFFKQHTQETCGISCMMMVLDYFGIDYPTVGKERRLYQIYVTRATAGTLGSAIAYGLFRRGLQVTLAHSSDKLMENRDGYYPDKLYNEILEEYRTFIQRADGGFSLETGVEINGDVLRQELMKDRLVILQCFVEGTADGMHDHVLHGILLYDCDEDHFYACDPICGKIQLADDEIENCIETPVGRMYISVGREEQETTPTGRTD